MKLGDVIDVTKVNNKFAFWWRDSDIWDNSMFHGRTRGEWGRLYTDNQPESFIMVFKVLSCQQPSKISKGKHTQLS